MKKAKAYMRLVSWLIIGLLAAPLELMAQGDGGAKEYIVNGR